MIKSVPIVLAGVSFIIGGFSVRADVNVTEPQWNPTYSEKHGLENQPITPEDFKEVESYQDEVVVVEEPQAKKKTKSLWERAFDFGPVGVEAGFRIGPFVFGSDPIKPPPIPAAPPAPYAKTTVHAKGKHSCWSNEALYTCNVELFDAFDCNEAGLRLKLQDCCPTYILNEKKLTNPKSTHFKLTKCGMWADKEEL